MPTEPELNGLPVPQAASTAVLTTAATNAVLTVIALATGVLAARLLGPEGRGHLAAAQAVGILVGAIGALALGEALVFFVGRQSRPPKVVLKTATLFAGTSTLVLIVVAILLMPRLLAGQPSAINAARAYTFIGLPFVLLGFPITFVRALQQFRLWNLLRLIAPLCWLAALVLFTMAPSADVEPLIIVFVLLQLIFVPMVWFLTGRLNGVEEGGRVDFSLIKPMLCYGAPLLMATLPHTLNLRFDQLLIANIETAEQLGLYAVSVSWAALGLPLVAAIGSVLFPRLAAMNREDASATLARSSRAGVMIAFFFGICSAVSAPMLVPLLFGRSFSVPFAIPVILAAATSVLGLNGIIEEGLRGMGEPRSVLIAELAGLAVTILLLIVLVSRLGITGAAVASLAGYTTVNASLAWRIHSRLGVGVMQLFVPRSADLHNVLHQVRAATLKRGWEN